jgi:hypothetical protein
MSKKKKEEFKIGWMEDCDFYHDMGPREAPYVHVYPTKKACEYWNSCDGDAKWDFGVIKVKVTRI